MRSERVWSMFGLPSVPPWIGQLLLALLGMWIIELLLVNYAHLPLYDWLAWDGSFHHPWTLITRYLVQGTNLLAPLLSLLVLYFALPSIDAMLPRRTIGLGFLASFIAGTLLSVLWSIVGFPTSIRMGWGVLASTAIALLGLSSPKSVVRVFFVLPLEAGYLVWITGLFLGMTLLASPSNAAADHFGAWLGLIGWWYGIGPGKTPRQRSQTSKRNPRSSKQFQVLQGGRTDDWH